MESKFNGRDWAMNFLNNPVQIFKPLDVYIEIEGIHLILYARFLKEKKLQTLHHNQLPHLRANWIA